MAIAVLLAISTLLRLIIGVTLFASARRNRLPNLYWLSAVFIISFISQLFSPSFPGNPLGALSISFLIQNGAIFPGGLFIIAFIHTTFYANKPSPVWEITALHFVLSALGLYGLIVSPSANQVSSLSAALSLSLVAIWGWHFIIARNSYLAIATDSSVSAWIKTRYRLMISYSIALAVGNASVSILWIFGSGNLNSALGGTLGLVSLAAAIIGVALQFLVWGLPEAALVGKSKRRQEEAAQQETSTIMQALSAAIAANSDIQPMIASYTLRTAIGSFFKLDDSNHIEPHALQMGFDDWTRLLDSAEFQGAFAPLMSRKMASEAISGAKQALLNRQSLFTMRAK